MSSRPVLPYLDVCLEAHSKSHRDLPDQTLFEGSLPLAVHLCRSYLAMTNRHLSHRFVLLSIHTSCHCQAGRKRRKRDIEKESMSTAFRSHGSIGRESGASTFNCSLWLSCPMIAVVRRVCSFVTSSSDIALRAGREDEHCHVGQTCSDPPLSVLHLHFPVSDSSANPAGCYIQLTIFLQSIFRGLGSTIPPLPGCIIGEWRR